MNFAQEQLMADKHKLTDLENNNNSSIAKILATKKGSHTDAIEI